VAVTGNPQQKDQQHGREDDEIGMGSGVGAGLLGGIKSHRQEGQHGRVQENGCMGGWAKRTDFKPVRGG